MKKILLGLLVLMTIFVSCTDQEDIEIAYHTELKVSASKIFNSFQPVQSTDFDLMTGWTVNLRSFVYDETGFLITKYQSYFHDLKDYLICNLDLKPGKYTIVSIANFEGSMDNEDFHYWDISGESDLTTLTITEDSHVLTWVYETLGMDITELEIKDMSPAVTIDIKPITALVQVEGHYDDIIGYGYDGYSMYAPTCTQLKIMAETRTQTVKINEDHDFVFGYIERSSSFPIADWEPKIAFENKKALTSLAYRAFLPESGRTFKWSWTHDYSNRGWGIITEESENTIPINFESGKQYDMDLVLDIPYLFIEEHDSQRDWKDRVKDYISNK